MTLRPPRVYVAGASRELPRVLSAMSYLRRLDVVITEDWAQSIIDRKAAGTLVLEDQMPDDASREIALLDLRMGVGDADVLLYLAPLDGTTTRGAWVELGYAAALRDCLGQNNAPLIVISGPTARQSIFCRVADLLIEDEDMALRSVAATVHRTPGRETPHDVLEFLRVAAHRRGVVPTTRKCRACRRPGHYARACGLGGVDG